MTQTADRPLRLAVLSNPNSGANRRGMDAIRQHLARYPQIPHYEVRTPAEVATALQACRRYAADIVAINSGDGTVQAALTILLEHKLWDKPPLLAILGGGSTNMTGGDVGLRGNHKKALARLLNWTIDKPRPLPIVQRPILRIRRGGEPALYGMFFGAGAIVKGIEYCHQHIYTLGLRDRWAPAWATLRVLLAMARGDSRYVAPASMDVSLDRQEFPSHEFLFLLVSSLERLFLGLRPYWGRETGPLHYTAVRTAPDCAWRALPGLFWGRANRLATPANGYFSHNINELRLTLDGGFTLDGEIYQADSRTGPVVVDSGGIVSFLRC